MSQARPSFNMLGPAYLEMPPLLLEQGAYQAVAAPIPQPVPGSYMGSYSAATYQRNKRSWLQRLQPGAKDRSNARVMQPIHPAALLHRDYLQEYREKYGALSQEHHMMIDPWHVPPVHHIHPAVVASASPNSAHLQQAQSTNSICACPGTKKLGKACKNCGRRVAGVNKGGTVRGGTVRGTTKVRPALNIPTPTISPMRLRPTPTSPQDEKKKSIPQCDPYDMMRRSRLSLQENEVGSIRTRSKSVSPTRARLSYPLSGPIRDKDEHESRLDEWVTSTSPSRSRSSSSESDEASRNNKSILECDVSAYELISKYLHPKEELDESDELSDNAILDEDPWNENVTTIPRINKNIVPKVAIKLTETLKVRTNSMPVLPQDEEVKEKTPKPPPRKRRIKKSSVIKSILKKTSFSSIEDGSNLYIPTYQEFKQRKKQVQFKSSSTELLIAREGEKIDGKSSVNDLNNKNFTSNTSERTSVGPDVIDTAASQQLAQLQLIDHISDKCVDNSDTIQSSEDIKCDIQEDLNQNNEEHGLKQDKQDADNQELVQSTDISTCSEDEPQTAVEKQTSVITKSKSQKRREGGSIVHIRGDHHKLFLDTMRLRMASQHRRGDSRVCFETSTPIRMLSPTRPKEPPPPPPPGSPPIRPQSWSSNNDIVVVTSPESTIVTVNDDNSELSSESSEYNTLRINIGNDKNLATILTVTGDEVEEKSCSNDYDIVEPIPHICSKGSITISDTSIIEKVENKRRPRTIESPYVSTSIKVSSADNWRNDNYSSTSIIVSNNTGNEDKKKWNNTGDEDKKWNDYETTITIDNKDQDSITDDDSSTKFYVTVEDEDDYDDAEIEDHYEMIRDPIYEEISVPTAKSIFEGASKYDILNYLVGAKERGIDSTREVSLLDLPALEDRRQSGSELGGSSGPSELVSHVSDSSEDALPLRSSPAKSRRSSAEIERNDSGVGSETSQSSRNRWLLQRRGNLDQTDLLCEDCEQTVEPQVTDSGVVYAPLVCRKCYKRRSERREIISELLETELKYGRDLRIMAEEFYRPMLVAGLLAQEQLDAIFLNVPELLEVSRQIAERLQDAVDIALDQGDEDLLTVNVGRLFLDCSHMLHAFETYCTRQGNASVLLSSLEKEKELLKIFLRVSQMENAVLRRMNLNSFLMVPVQRVTKYPLLLARLFKATPPHHEAREMLKQAQQKIETHLEHMNAEAKDLSTTRLWRRISIINVPGRRSNAEPDLNIRLRKLALEVLGWNHEDVRFVMEGRLLFTQPTDSNWRKGRTIKLSHLNALLVTHAKGSDKSRHETVKDDALTFPRDAGIQEAALLLLKDKAGRCSLLRESLSLDKCIICADLQDIEDCFEVQEIPTRDTFIFKAEDAERTREWCRSLQFHAQSLGGWRRRRNALANIMMNGMEPRS